MICTASSAGGLEALMALMQELPTGTGASYVVAQHMAPDHAEGRPCWRAECRG